MTDKTDKQRKKKQQFKMPTRLEKRSTEKASRYRADTKETRNEFSIKNVADMIVKVLILLL